MKDQRYDIRRSVVTVLENQIDAETSADNRVSLLIGSLQDLCKIQSRALAGNVLAVAVFAIACGLIYYYHAYDEQGETTASRAAKVSADAQWVAFNLKEDGKIGKSLSVTAVEALSAEEVHALSAALDDVADQLSLSATVRRNPSIKLECHHLPVCPESLFLEGEGDQEWNLAHTSPGIQSIQFGIITRHDYRKPFDNPRFQEEKRRRRRNRSGGVPSPYLQGEPMVARLKYPHPLAGN